MHKGLNNNVREGLKIVLSGPSGSGKGTIVKSLVKDYGFQISISATTRNPRKGEEDGVHYFFKTTDEFEKMISQNELLEYAKFCGNYYGTPKSFIEDCARLGKDVILEIEVQGAEQIKDIYPEAVFVFVIPPSMKELENRLIGRSTETREVIDARLKRAKEELALYDNYDYIVINESLEQAVEDIKNIAVVEKLRSKNFDNKINDIIGQ